MQPFVIGQKIKIHRTGKVFFITACSWEPGQTEPKPITPLPHWITPPKDKKAAEKFEPFIPMPHPEPTYELDSGLAVYHHEIELVD